VTGFFHFSAQPCGKGYKAFELISKPYSRWRRFAIGAIDKIHILFFYGRCLCKTLNSKDHKGPHKVTQRDRFVANDNFHNSYIINNLYSRWRRFAIGAIDKIHILFFYGRCLCKSLNSKDHKGPHKVTQRDRFVANDNFHNSYIINNLYFQFRFCFFKEQLK
jgi:hypothetical protein